MGFPKKFSFALRFLSSLWSYALEGEPRPFSASYAITNRCNLRCLYCNYPFLSPETLSLPKIEILFKNLKALGVQRLGIVGGEPLVYPGIERVLEMARGMGFYLTLNTNLTLYLRHREAFTYVDLVFTSLDGKAEIHERQRGKGSFRGVLEAIRDLRTRGIPVVPICVVTEENMDTLEELFPIAESLDVSLHFQPLCTGAEITRGECSGNLTKRFQRCFSRLLEAKRSGAPIASSSLYLEYLSRWPDYSRSAFFDPAFRCSAGYAFLYVDHLGRGYPCPYLKGKVPGIPLLSEDWKERFSRETPCTRCAVGPMVEFNLLYRFPHRTLGDLYRSYRGLGLA